MANLVWANTHISGYVMHNSIISFQISRSTGVSVATAFMFWVSVLDLDCGFRFWVFVLGSGLVS